MINPVVLNAPPVDAHIRNLKRLNDSIKPEFGSSMLRSRASTILKSHNLDQTFQTVTSPTESVVPLQEAGINTVATEDSPKSTTASPAKLILQENLTLLRSDPVPIDAKEPSFFHKLGHLVQSFKNFKKIFFHGQISHSN